MQKIFRELFLCSYKRLEMKKLGVKILFVSILFLIFIYLVLKSDYQSFTYQLLDYYNKTDRIIFFRQNMFTETRFKILKIVSIAIYILISISFLWKGKVIYQNFTRYRKPIFEELKFTLKSVLKKIKSIWKQTSIIEKAALFAPLLIYTAFWWIYGWQNDEIFSYTFLVDRGILVCATYYPGPNNHVAFLVFAAFLNHIIPSFFSDFICLKLPATLASIFSLWTIWFFFYRKNQKTIAWLLFVLIAFAWNFFFYATHGRGYSWIILLFVWSCYAVFKIVTIPSNRFQTVNYWKYWFFWSFCVVLGCYTIPIFVYVWFGSLIGLWSIASNKIRKESTFVSFICGVIILFLYSPILVFNGILAIVSNSWIAPLDLENWLSQFPSYLFDVHGIVGTLAFLASLLLFFTKKEFRKVVIYFWCVAYCPYLIVFVQKVLPFERVFLYRQIAEILMLCFCIGTVVREIRIPLFQKKGYKSILQIAFIIFFISYASFRMYREYYRWNIQISEYSFAEPLARRIYKQNPSSILVLEDTYNVFLRYYFRDSDTKIDVLSDVANDKTLSYQIIILPKNGNFSLSKTNNLNYKIFYEDDFVIGYSVAHSSE